MMYKVKVKLNKDFVEIHGAQITVGLTSKPKKGEANRELIKKLAKQFSVSSSRIKIVSGFTSKNKIVQIT